MVALATQRLVARKLEHGTVTRGPFLLMDLFSKSGNGQDHAGVHRIIG